MSIGIYKYTNKLNNQVYIGQSDNLEGRFKQHIYDTAHTKERSVTGIDYAMAADGIDNFDFEIIELCDINQLDERERYWVSYYDSYHNGYNRTPGGKSVRGEEHPRAILTEQEVWDIREQYKNKIGRKIVFEPYLQKGITKRCLLKVWNNETWTGVHQDAYTEEARLWHKNNVGHSDDQIGLSSLDRTIKQNDIDLWRQEYKNGATINAIANKYKRDYGTVQKYINKQQAYTKVSYRGRNLRNVETGLVFTSITKAAKWAKCGATTLTRHLATDMIAGTVPELNINAHWEEVS